MARIQGNSWIRWLALISAAGAAACAAAAHLRIEPVWSIAALALALVAVVAIAGWWRSTHSNPANGGADAMVSGEQKREVSALQQELAIHRQLERELIEAKQAAEAAMMAKGEFLATMSHEIRTPLNGIIPMLDLLMAAKMPPDQHDILRTAYTSARQMLRIVDDILDYSKLEANKLQLESTSFNLRELLDSVIQLLDKAAESKGLRLTLHIDPSVRLPVRGDPVRLRQVLANLLSNAVKFTERGTVSLHVTRRGETRSQHELRFEVRDTGIGIAQANTRNLFQPFSQADNSTTRLYGGTGLGLVICKRIVDLMGGSIGVDSESGRGSTFWFEIPLLKAAGDIQGQRTDLHGSRVLLLSNDPILRQRLVPAIPSWGAQLTESTTTQDALNRLRTAAGRGQTWTFDLLVVDLNSVRTTAIALHRNLRRAAELEGLRVVYLQGHEPPSPELAEGGSLIIPRTMGPGEMRIALSNFFAAPIPIKREPEPESQRVLSPELPPTPPPEAAGNAPEKLQGRVLLVEDNPVNQMVAQRLIGMFGLGCEAADNGEKALTRMRAGDLDLVLMDCQMPVKDGYTATREWREYELTHDMPRLPIIAMTANAMAGDRQKCLEAGMDDYVSKPVDRRHLQATMARWLKESPRKVTGGGRAPDTPPAIVAASPAPIVAAASPPIAQRAAPPPAPAASPLPAASAPPAQPVLSMEVVDELRMVMGDEYLNLIRLFLQDAPAHIKKLEAAAAANDVPAMVAPAHTLKSSSANLGALGLSSVAKRIELGARGEALPRPTVAVLMLENEFKRAKVALEALLIGG